MFEGLSATGLRSIRFAKEIKNLEKAIANDFDPVAVEFINQNITHNNVQDKVESSLGDANFIMYKAINEKKKFDVIDLDPYGSAAPFIDAAIRTIVDGGLLCVTSTDMGVLAGGWTETCFAKYGGTCIPNSPFCHELGLRLLLSTLQTCASRYEKYIVPLVSLSIDFYVRIFVRVYSSPNERKKAASKTSLVFYCHSCKSFVTQPLGRITAGEKSVKYGTCPLSVGSSCPQCTGNYHIGGPMYSGSLHCKEFLAKMIDHITANKENYGTNERMLGMLTVASEEIDAPLYYTIPSLCSAVRAMTLPLKKFM